MNDYEGEQFTVLKCAIWIYKVNALMISDQEATYIKHFLKM